MSSSVVTLNLETDNYLTPQQETKYGNQIIVDDWKDNAFNKSSDYQLYDENSEKIDTMISFTKNLLNNSKDIENEFVDIVNDNFWDLI
ncbi:hypothetical protein [Marivirga sp.]|uniref:hypothetical protein n=1 Tax=Marivirga sp. TaxID=2018662 RepID=UPI0026002C76|nr:hypothetical protein [Marivirga sp.]